MFQVLFVGCVGCVVCVVATDEKPPLRAIPNADLIEKHPTAEIPAGLESFAGFDFIKSITITKSIHLSPQPRRKRSIISKENICDYNPDGFSSCSPDCSGRILCKAGKVSSIIRCPDQKPFCDPHTRTCVQQIDFCVYNSSLDIHADPPGYSYCDGRFYPDLKDCRMFSYCEDSYFYRYRCQGVSAFDPVREICSTQVKCYDFGDKGLCRDADLGTVEFPLDRSRFVICSANNTPFLGDCNYFGNNEINSTYNPRTSKCELNCLEEGRFDDPNDLSASYLTYVECIHDAATGVVRGYTRECPAGTNYDVQDKVCRKFPAILQLRNKIPLSRTCGNSIYAKACSLVGEVGFEDFLRQEPDFVGTRVSCVERSGGAVKKYLFKCSSETFKEGNYLPQCRGEVLGCGQNVTRFIGNVEYKSTLDRFLLVFDCSGEGLVGDLGRVKIRGCGVGGAGFSGSASMLMEDFVQKKKAGWEKNFWKQFMNKA